MESGDKFDYFDDDEFDDAFSDEEGDNLYSNQQPTTHQNLLLDISSQFQNNQQQQQQRSNIAAAKPGVGVKPFVQEKLPPPILPQRTNNSTPPRPISTQNAVAAKVSHNNNHKPPLASKAMSKPAISKKPVLAPKPSVESKPMSNCVALYDYRSDEGTDLSFMSGSVIQILERTDNAWWKGKLNQFEGYFPCSYVCLLYTSPSPRDRG